MDADAFEALGYFASFGMSVFSSELRRLKVRECSCCSALFVVA